ncbi:MAG: hemerythrin domain-containing protein [Bacteroidetes bacterium]|nr:MAG: hemerythrin domain-containing protein [Bacteroidota bacterium]
MTPMVERVSNYQAESVRDPISVLMEEHRQAFEHLMKLEQAVSSMDEQGFNRAAFENLAEAIRFFDSDFRLHDRKEEQILFPFLERYKPGITGEYRNEHRELWSAFNTLLSCVHDVEDGRLRGTSRHELTETAKKIIRLLRGHMMNENTYLFVQTKNMLSDAEYTDLSEKIAAAAK